MVPSPHSVFEFGEFRLDPREKLLWRNQSVVDIKPKAFDVLTVLVENAGHLVTKETIFQHVWQESVVEEANLSHQIFRLRHALGESEGLKFIETVPRRGYRFVAEVIERKIEPSTAEPLAIAPPRGNRRKSLSIAGVAALLIALIGAPLLAYLAWSKFSARQTASTNESAPRQDHMTISRITTSGKIATSTVSPDGKFIAYSENHFDGSGSIFLRQVDTNAEVELIPPGERIFGSMSFSPDNRYIHYIIYDQQQPRGALYRIPVLGGQPVKLLEHLSTMFTLSPDGRQASFFREEAGQARKSLIIASLDGSGARSLLTRRNHEMQFGEGVAWSPDGKMIAFSAAENPIRTDDVSPDKHVYLVDVETGALRKLSKETLGAEGMMNWLKDQSGLVLFATRPRIGNQIFFLSYPGGELRRITKELNVYGNYGLGVTADSSALIANLWETSAQLWVTDANGSTAKAEQLTNGISDGSRGLIGLTDGRIVYSTRTGEDTDIWILSDQAGRREGRPLTSDSFSEGELCATADNRFLVFTSDQAGGQHLFRATLDGSEVKQLTFGDEFNSMPVCLQKEPSVVYVSNKNGATTLWRISIDGGNATQLTNFEATAPSLSPDEESIACIVPSDSVVKSAKLIVVSARDGQPQKTFEVVPFAWSYRPARWTPDGRALIFHKTEKQIGNLWKQNLTGGEPQRFTDFKSEMIFNYVFSADGTRLYISRGKRTVNVVMLKDFR